MGIVHERSLFARDSLQSRFSTDFLRIFFKTHYSAPTARLFKKRSVASGVSGENRPVTKATPPRVFGRPYVYAERRFVRTTEAKKGYTATIPSVTLLVSVAVRMGVAENRRDEDGGC